MYCRYSLSLTLCSPVVRSSSGFPVLHYLLEFAQIHVHWVVMPSRCLIFCCPLLLLPWVFPSITVFSNVLALCIKGPKYWSFSISPSNEYSGLISVRINWFDLLASRKTQKSFPPPQFKSINSLVLSLLYALTLISTHDYWKTHRFDYMGLCWQSDVFAYQYTV